jgi:hypothetical protein
MNKSNGRSVKKLSAKPFIIGTIINAIIAIISRFIWLGYSIGGYEEFFAAIFHILITISIMYAVYHKSLSMWDREDRRKEVILKIDRINTETALQFMSIRGEPPRHITELMDKYAVLLLERIAPRCIYETFPSVEGWTRSGRGGFLRGSDIKTHLDGCDEIIILAATLGLQVDELIRQTEASDMAGAVVLDALASAAIEQLCDDVEKEIKLSTVNCQLSTRYSPGYGDFPLEVQPELLELLGARKKIGLYVNQSNLLIPRKSVTAILGVKK